jgi:hypothetical protein
MIYALLLLLLLLFLHYFKIIISLEIALFLAYNNISKVTLDNCNLTKNCAINFFYFLFLRYLTNYLEYIYFS